jgi:beta-glucosidase/6-phospho-beta-glucosidase/beta-galactosidase
MQKLPGGDKSKIGFAKNIVIYDPYNQYNLSDNILTWLLDKAWNGISEQFFLTGEFNFFGLKKLSMPEAPQSLDYIGLNYYTHIGVKLTPGGLVNQIRPEYPKTDMDYGIYAEGFYRSLKMIEKFKVPIYITENGMLAFVKNSC